MLKFIDFIELYCCFYPINPGEGEGLLRTQPIITQTNMSELITHLYKEEVNHSSLLPV